MTNAEKERQQAGLCIIEGCNKPRMVYGTGSGYRSKWCRDHYRQRDKRSRYAPPVPVYDMDSIIKRLHEIVPEREPPHLLSYKSDTDATHWVDYTAKCKFWRLRVDVWLLLNGTYRPPREFDAVTRAQAQARLAELTSGGERGAA